MRGGLFGPMKVGQTAGNQSKFILIKYLFLIMWYRGIGVHYEGIGETCRF